MKLSSTYDRFSFCLGVIPIAVERSDTSAGGCSAGCGGCPGRWVGEAEVADVAQEERGVLGGCRCSLAHRRLFSRREA